MRLFASLTLPEVVRVWEQDQLLMLRGREEWMEGTINIRV